MLELFTRQRASCWVYNSAQVRWSLASESLAIDMGYREVITPYVISTMTEEHTGCWGTREEASHTALGVLDKVMSKEKERKEEKKERKRERGKEERWKLKNHF